MIRVQDLFSKRKGLSLVRETVQKDSMDSALRSCLWDAWGVCVWQKKGQSLHYHRFHSFKSSNLYAMFQLYWHDLFKIPLDDMPVTKEDAYGKMKKRFFE